MGDSVLTLEILAVALALAAVLALLGALVLLMQPKALRLARRRYHLSFEPGAPASEAVGSHEPSPRFVMTLGLLWLGGGGALAALFYFLLAAQADPVTAGAPLPPAFGAVLMAAGVLLAALRDPASRLIETARRAMYIGAGRTSTRVVEPMHLVIGGSFLSLAGVALLLSGVISSGG